MPLPNLPISDSGRTLRCLHHTLGYGIHWAGVVVWLEDWRGSSVVCVLAGGAVGLVLQSLDESVAQSVDVLDRLNPKSACL